MKKTVLMLDHEPMMIDRRIVLEGQSLVQAGYRVILATRGDGQKKCVDIERGIEVLRFPLEEQGGEHHSIVGDMTQIDAWNGSPGNPDLERAVRDRFAFLPRIVQSVIYGVACPEVFASSLRNRVPTLKLIFGRLFEPIVYTLLLRPRYLVPYWRVFKYRARLSFRNRSSKEGLEPFQQDIYTYAVNKIRPDVVHAHDLPNLELGIKIASKVGAKLVYDAHELYPMQHFSSELQRSKLADLEKRLIGKADAIIAVNRQCEEVLRRIYPEAKEIVILSNATESPAGFNPVKKGRLWHERFSLDPTTKVMVFQGGINPVRNVDHLVRAMVHVPDNIHVGFITYRKDIPYYQALTSQLGISHRVHYVVEIPWDEVIHWLSSADVGVMPYQAASFNAKISSPNKLFEFVVAGLPIIASSELDNVKEAVDKYGIGVYRLLREDDSYIEAIQDMFDEEKGGPARFASNVLSVRNLFMWDNEAPRLLNLYERLTNRSAECAA